MALKKLSNLAFIACIGCAAYSARAADWSWNGNANNGLWSDPANWSAGTVPPADPASTGVNVFLAVGNGTQITISNGEVENPGVQTTVVHPPWNTIYGPDFGQWLNLYGSLSYDWVIAPVQNDPTPGARGGIRMYGNSLLQCNGGAALALGDQWWYFAAPYVSVNMYGNSQVNMTNGAGFWQGGHLNIYDTARFSIGAGGYFNMDNRGSISDGTRSLVIGGGTLSLPTGWTNAGTSGENSGTVYEWIERGVLRAYGKGYDTNDLVILDDGTNTTVTTVPLGGALQRIYFQPLLRSSVQVGTFQQMVLVGDYPSVSGVLLSSSEPGLNPTVIGTPTYSSSNPGVATVNANGIVTAVGAGSTTLSATLGVLTSTNTLTLTVTPVSSTLTHRYSFNESSGTTAADSVGGAFWNATLQGTAAFDGAGQVTLDGNTNGLNYVLLPAGIVSNYNELTIEVWATFAVTITNNFENLWAFGDQGTDPLAPTFGLGANLIAFAPHNANNTATLNFGQGLPANEGERDAVIGRTLDGEVNMLVASVYRPSAGIQAVYTNGLLAASISMFNNLIDPVACVGPLYTNRSLLAFQLGNDPINFIGKSLYNPDPGFFGSINEFRIYNGPRSAAQIAADYALGPGQLMGTSTTVTLSAVPSGSNIVVSWSTNSALVTLLSSPALGVGASWTPVIGTLTVSGGNYQMTFPTSDAARFFRLSL
jgi:hypothetical protein